MLSVGASIKHFVKELFHSVVGFHMKFCDRQLLSSLIHRWKDCRSSSFFSSDLIRGWEFFFDQSIWLFFLDVQQMCLFKQTEVQSEQGQIFSRYKSFCYLSWQMSKLLWWPADKSECCQGTGYLGPNLDPKTFYKVRRTFLSSHFQKLADNKFIMKFPPFRQVLVCLQVLCKWVYIECVCVIVCLNVGMCWCCLLCWTSRVLCGYVHK